MSTLVIVLRTVSLLAFAGPMLLGVNGRHGEPKTRASREGGGRAPVVTNLSAFGLFFPSLLIFSGSSEASMALPLALSGCLLALAGAALVLRSGAELGSAWSFVPKADQGTGLVITGPYRLVRHPSTWASHCSSWAKRSPSAAGLPFTFARHLPERGSSLKEVADVLLHRSLNTSLIYAKLDHRSLSGVALPWPGSVSWARWCRSCPASRISCGSAASWGLR